MHDDDAVGYAAVTRPGRLAGEDFRDHDFTEADLNLMSARERWEREKRIQAIMARVRREDPEYLEAERTLFDLIKPRRGPELFKEAS
jgi:hypothetical protein